MTADTAATALDWDRLFQTHYRSLYRALVGATGRTDGVDDAIQDAFAQGLRGKLPGEVRSVEGKVLGSVSSTAHGDDDGALALAMVRLDFTQPGTKLDVGGREATVLAGR